MTTPRRLGRKLVAMERKWIETAVTRRAENENVDSQYEDDEDDEDAAGWTDMFADPNPHETFTFQFELGDENENDRGSTRTIEIVLQGYKAELGQTLHSTGLTLWRASDLLCQYMLSLQQSKRQQESKHDNDDNDNWIQNKTVLELGAGLGLCGILAHHLGAAHTIATDGDTDTLEFLRQNVERNCCSNAATASVSRNNGKGSSRLGCAISCQQLIWGDKAQVKAILHSHGPIDTILGSDIIYSVENLEPLWETVSLLLPTTSSGRFVLAYARRNVPMDLVFCAAKRAGFEGIAGGEQSAQQEDVFVFQRSREANVK